MGDVEARCVPDAQLLGDALVAVDEEGDGGAECCRPGGSSPGGTYVSYLASCVVFPVLCRWGLRKHSVEGVDMESGKVRRFCAVWVNVVSVMHGAPPPCRLVVGRPAVVSRRRGERSRAVVMAVQRWKRSGDAVIFRG